ncbi:MAG: 16S/23S rRNA (cytidine-2'-O)-methyltransferase TlyA [Alphaproteobacteria bacterium MarineAlpha5_Bin8]|nr:MAG: 16S/23S rRNA (cytidine-2'-O)-methyltransferase TlyA [Alphaproteobacteria bacterium MarineAlpha5_Bin7]PPR48411.1 MAG: 16S/23S rRNA (cytidine-2'-O)-methyltransferase TlyA [Alphaproteobacteria bacterium MarineAlpha5_Bin8]PPR54408.1 MAG: 16S/23S rRNA (cytidine-2'-O)-methyltransferase TlyA [Alphaproteobacteria bacterium MarineAlpha5_Bin6]
MKKRADIVLFEKDLAESRSKAQAMIMAGQIRVDGKKITKSGTIIDPESEILVSNLHSEWVSRGAIKIIHAINFFEINIQDYICLDIGSSTGGFTEVLLKKNAKKIYSVDVGTNQLHEKLKKEKRIISLENTNARYLSKNIIKEQVDLIVCDVSFISMKKVLQQCINFLKQNNGEILGLIKPQFEAQKREIKGGIVKDQNIHNRICDDFKEWFPKYLNMNVIGLTQSPVKGPKGNIEFFIYAKRN